MLALHGTGVSSIANDLQSEAPRSLYWNTSKELVSRAWRLHLAGKTSKELHVQLLLTDILENPPTGTIEVLMVVANISDYDGKLLEKKMLIVTWKQNLHLSQAAEKVQSQSKNVPRDWVSETPWKPVHLTIPLPPPPLPPHRTTALRVILKMCTWELMIVTVRLKTLMMNYCCGECAINQSISAASVTWMALVANKLIHSSYSHVHMIKQMNIEILCGVYQCW